MLLLEANPVLPAWANVAQALVFILIAAVALLPIAALFSIWYWRSNMETTHVLIWAAIVIFAPFIGSIVWFAVGKRLHPDVTVAARPPYSDARGLKVRP